MYWLLQYLLGCDRYLTVKRLMIFFAIDHVNATGRYGMELSPTANPEKEPRHSVAYFERLLSVPRATMSRDIQKLEKIGWIKTKKKGSEKLIFVTPKGKDLLYFANRHVMEHSLLIDDFGQKEFGKRPNKYYAHYHRLVNEINPQ